MSEMDELQQTDAEREAAVRADAAWFAGVPERNTGDALLNAAQQHNVALSAMADSKANIIITVASIVLTLSLGKFGDADLRLSVLTLSTFTLIALLLAILAVLPKYRRMRLRADELPPKFNLFFMGHFSQLPRERFLREVARSLCTDGSVYAAMTNDIYSLGVYLSDHKYRYLRWSYLSFLTGFVLAVLEQLWHMAVH